MESVSPTVPLPHASSLRAALAAPGKDPLLVRRPSVVLFRVACNPSQRPNPNGDRLIRKSGLTYDAARSV